MSNAGARRAAREPAVGNKRDGVVEFHAFDRGGRGEHFLHTRSALRSFITYDDNVARLYLTFDDSAIRFRFRIKNNGRTGMLHHLGQDARRLNDGAVRRKIAEEDRETARLTVRFFASANAVFGIESKRHILNALKATAHAHWRNVAAFAGGNGVYFQRFVAHLRTAEVVIVDILANRLARYRGSVVREGRNTTAAEFAKNRVDTARIVNVFDMVIAAWRDFANVGRRRAEFVKAIKRIRKARFVSDREKMKNRIGTPAHRHIENHCVIDRTLRNDFRRQNGEVGGVLLF